MTDENFDTDSTAPASTDEAQPETAEAGGDAPYPAEGDAPESEAPAEEAAEVKPREVIKGIHPELLC
ncbi:MAG: hypothetical protein ACK46X_15505, partial [Candidatus Sericytochromatia bacterium]